METSSAENFDRMGTLGVEEEFFVVDEAGRPTAGSDELVYESDPPALLDGRIDHELFKFVIETQTPLIEDVRNVSDHVTSVRQALLEHAHANGFDIAAAGLHPVATWRTLEHAQKPRYRRQLDRIQYPQHRNTTAGIHAHVGVDDADKAVWIANQARWYLPLVLAVSANSPYWDGYDTGLQSARAKIFEGLPNTGMPTEFDSFESFARFERRMLETGSINDRGELWFEVRPHTEYGTVEIRTPDAQHDPEMTVAFVEYAHALVTDLAERYEDGASGHDCRREILDENKWRAIRYGQDASLVSRDCSESIDLGELVDREAERLGVDALSRIYDRESGAKRQRRIHEDAGVDALCDAIRIA
jgi:carboxylate-amine ligase